LPVVRKSVHDLFTRGQFMYFIPVTAVLVEVLVERATEADLAEAKAAVDRLAAIQGADGWAARDVMLLRLRALLARAHGDTEEVSPANLLDQLASLDPQERRALDRVADALNTGAQSAADWLRTDGGPSGLPGLTMVR
jgi:hypothetical protein